jgi:hypothetical protein
MEEAKPPVCPPQGEGEAEQKTVPYEKLIGCSDIRLISLISTQKHLLLIFMELLNSFFCLKRQYIEKIKHKQYQKRKRFTIVLEL